MLKEIGLYDSQESFQLCCSKVLSMEKRMGLWEDLLGTLSGYTIQISDPGQVSDGEAPKGRDGG